MTHDLIPSQRLGVVTALVAGPPPTVTIQVGGDTASTVDAPYLDHLAPLVGDVVVVHIVRGAPLVTGRVQTRPGSWTALTPAAGWATNGGSNALAYSVQAGAVWLRGVLKTAAGTGANAAVVTLPAGARPGVDQQLVLPGGTGPTHVLTRVDVTAATGAVTVALAQPANGLLFFDGAAPIPTW